MASGRLLLLLSAAMSLTGCLMFARHEEGTPSRKGPGFESAVKNLTDEDKTALKARRLFALRLARAIDLGGDGRNACVSPLGADQSMSLLLNGAQGKTFESCALVMGLTNPRADKLNVTSSRLLDLLSSEPGRPVLVANSLWNVFPTRFSKQYQIDMAMSYDANIQKLGSARQSALQQVNDWVSNKTNGKVTKFFDKLDPLALAMTVSLVTFDAEWESPFPAATTGTFAAPSGKKSAAFLRDTDRSASGLTKPDFTSLTLPFKDGSLSMSLVLPVVGRPVNALLTPEVVDQVTLQSKQVSAEVSIPKFGFADRIDLSGPIGKMGGAGLFRAENDFSLMSHEMKKGVAVGKFLQFAQIEVDERGAKAVSTTVTETFKADPLPFKFVADRPFLFFVWEKHTQTILFIGVVCDPTQ